MRELNDDTTGGTDASAGELNPIEMAELIEESATLLPGSLLGTAVFAALAWFIDGIAWLHAIAVVVAIVLGLRTVWHAGFLIRAALRFRDELHIAVEQAEKTAALDRFLRGLTDDHDGGR
ncbi:hypothetical protein AB0M83_02540 [Amycolatopsis sp. NPDC051106]|uniref:hypothetical protein n=1 Tax=unclassified Amycolatopsis TaxID=2618356 RepID=UPI003416A41D